ncbi:MAG: hypothetical protein PUK67_08520 [Prevotellaceae bacterium]|nr:hypothetical protein [Prevotellaceae bacterium]MDY3366160.1 hypothetical protein [Prevotella sp.]
MKKRNSAKSVYCTPRSVLLACAFESNLLTGSFGGGHQPGGGGNVIGDASFDGTHESATGGVVISDKEENGTHVAGQGGGILGDDWQ